MDFGLHKKDCKTQNRRTDSYLFNFIMEVIVQGDHLRFLYFSTGSTVSKSLAWALLGLGFTTPILLIRDQPSVQNS